MRGPQVKALWGRSLSGGGGRACPGVLWPGVGGMVNAGVAENCSLIRRVGRDTAGGLHSCAEAAPAPTLGDRSSPAPPWTEPGVRAEGGGAEGGGAGRGLGRGSALPRPSSTFRTVSGASPAPSPLFLHPGYRHSLPTRSAAGAATPLHTLGHWVPVLTRRGRGKAVGEAWTGHGRL